MAGPYAYTPKTLGALWLVSPTTIVNLIRNRRLKAFRVGRQYRIRPEDAEAYRAQETTGPRGSGDDQSTEMEHPPQATKPKVRSGPPILFRRL